MTTTIDSTNNKTNDSQHDIPYHTNDPNDIRLKFDIDDDQDQNHTTNNNSLSLLNKVEGLDITFSNVTYDIPLYTTRTWTQKLRSLTSRCHPSNTSDNNHDPSSQTPTPTTKRILHGIDGAAHSGELLAIMGPSGGGKTSFLNLIASRAQIGSMQGEIRFNGQKRNKAVRRKVAYVMQDDLFFNHLTVQETLEFTANLRLERSVPKDQVQRRVNTVIDKLKLAKARNTLIGDQHAGIKGISGGERKRVNISNELLINPPILLLDEPTSGLDSTTAYTVVDVLRQLAHEDGRTVICSIHQPSSQILAMFDKLLLLAEGHVVYFGKMSAAVSYFSSLGYPCPFGYNPADFFMELVAASENKDTTETRNHLIDAWESNKDSFLSEVQLPSPSVKKKKSGFKDLMIKKLSHKSISEKNVKAQNAPEDDEEDDEEDDSPKYPSSWLSQTRTLAIRAYKEKKGKFFDAVSLIQTIVLALLVGCVWFQMGTTESSIQDRIGVLFFGSVFWGFNGLFMAIFVFPPEKAVLNKDRASALYSLSAYFVAKSTVEIPFDVIYPTLFCIISYWMTGQNPEFGRFVIFTIVIVITTMAAESVGLAISGAVMDIKKAQMISTLFMLGSMLVGGFYVNSENLPNWISWLQYLSFIKYSYEALMINEFSGTYFTCVPDNHSEYSDSGNICPVDDQAIYKARNMSDTLGVGGNVGILIAFLFGFRFLAYLALRFFHRAHKKSV